MIHAESPPDPPDPPQPLHAKRRPPTPEPELTLPESLTPWIAALSLWPSVDQGTFRLVAHCFGHDRTPEWPFLTSLLEKGGLVASGAQPDAFTFRPEWLLVLDTTLADLGGADVARSALIDAWLLAPDRNLAAQVARWASDQARWDAVDMIWMALAATPDGPPTQALAVFRDLPVEARRARPMLTYASGAAESLLGPATHRGEATLQRLLLDSAMVHSDWSKRADTDAAVAAGTIRLVGQRRLPSTRAGDSLASAWQTKQEIDAFIDARSRAGSGPGRTTHAVFRAFSGRLALFLGDPARAVSEARWAALLSNWEPISVLASGIEALAAMVSSDDAPTTRSTGLDDAVDDSPSIGVFKGLGQALQVLAEAFDALRRLDRDHLDRSLSSISSEAAAIAGVWSVRSSLIACRAALWGDPGSGANRLSVDISRQSVFVREHEEPFGGGLLTKARILLLTKMGAFGAALQAVGYLPEPLRVLPTARIHLWSGQLGRAVATAESGIHQEGLTVVDRSRLTLLKAAAALMAGTCDPGLRTAALTELRCLVLAEAFLPIALLPTPAREELAELYRGDVDPGDPGLRLLTARLGELNDAAAKGLRHVRLTEREIILLPLLAGDASVPEIARKLHVSVNTVRKQVVTLREKFGANTRVELIRLATVHGVLR